MAGLYSIKIYLYSYRLQFIVFTCVVLDGTVQTIALKKVGKSTGWFNIDLCGSVIPQTLTSMNNSRVVYGGSSLSTNLYLT